MIKDFNKLDHEYFMKEALREAEDAGKRGDLPIGAVIVHEGKIIARGSNGINTQNSQVAHAENTAIFSCAAYLKEHGKECIIYSTVEPCVMCLSTIVLANIRSVVFALEDKYMNMKPFIESNPYIKNRVHSYLGGVCVEESVEIIRRYAPEALEIMQRGAV